MKIEVIDKLSLKNRKYLNVIEKISNKITEYSEFKDLSEFYKTISIILFDKDSNPDEVIKLWGDSVGLSISPTQKTKYKASSLSNNKKGSIYIFLPFIFDELPRNTNLNEYLGYILHHEFCHLKLHRGEIITCNQSLMSLLNLYEKIPQRKDFGKSLVDSLRQNNEHYFVNKYAIERYPDLFLKQRYGEKERMVWNMKDYPRMTHKSGLDVSISEALCETIILTRKKFEIETFDKERDELMTFFNGLYDMFISLISKSVSPPDIASVFTAEVFDDKEQYGKKIYEIWESLKLTDPSNVPIFVGERNCGICRKQTRSHILDYGGSVCHSCWTTFFI